jgi:hypothetical protein
MSMVSSLLSELSTIELLVMFLIPPGIVAGVYLLFLTGALGPDLEPAHPQ